MDSPQQPNLPVIEFTNLSPGTDSWRSTSEAVRHALESYGCFVIQYEEMSTELYEETFRGLEEVFGLPSETKRKHTSQLPSFGYGGNFASMPLYEYFGINEEDAADLESKTNFAALLWPDGNHHFCETLNSYSTVLLELERTVLKMLASSYGLEKHYDPLIESSFYMTKLMRYREPAGKNSTSSVGIVPHRDKNFMALIGTNQVRGLEIETRDGDWISFEPSPQRFIFIVGESLMAWSNGRVYCPLHKVVARGREEKYSVGIFSFVRGVLEVPQELVDDENPLRFKPFNNLEFLDYCREGGPKMIGAIHAFCGL